MRIQVQNVSKSFGKNRAVSNATLDVHENELLVLVGSSGCGKSTLLKLIAGLEQPNDGVICIAGKDVAKVEPRHRGCSMAFQDGACYDHWSVERNIVHASENHQDIADNIIIRLELDSCRHRYPTEISGGERQRVSLARALVSPKPILLLDEPLAQLNPKLRSDARELIEEIHRDRNKTTLYVTHDVTEAMLLGDRIAIVEQGNVIQCGRPRELLDPPTTEAAASLFGSFVRPVDTAKPFAVPHSWTLTRWNNLRLDENADEHPLSQIKGNVIRCKWVGSGWIVRVKIANDTQPNFTHPFADVWISKSSETPQSLRDALRECEENLMEITIEARTVGIG
jgi:ABC-type sugar transport system ATPase subunit